MTTAFAWLGGIVIALWILGCAGVIDFHVCIAAPGKCECKINKEGHEQNQ